MPYIGNIIQDFSVSTAMLNTDSVTSIKVLDGTIVNADINASAAIQGTKISPDFGSQNITTTNDLNGKSLNLTHTSPQIQFIDSNGNPDYTVKVDSGLYKIIDATNSNADRFVINTDGHIDIAGNVDFGAGIDVTGAITSTGKVQAGDDVEVVVSSGDAFILTKGGTNQGHLVKKTDNTTVAGLTNGGAVSGSVNDAAVFAPAGDLKLLAGGNNVNSNLIVDVTSSGIDVTGNITATGSLTISSANPQILLTDTGDNPDYVIKNNNGAIQINDNTNGATRLAINTDGHLDIAGNVDFGAGIDVTGNITATGNISATGGQLTLENGNEEQIHRFWSNISDSDIYGLLSGSTFGTIVEGANNGHHVIALRDNDVNDSVAIISGGGDFKTGSPADTYDKLVARFRANGNTVIGGTLDVAGGLDVEGATVFNESGANVDFRVEGDTDANLLFVDASTDRVGIGTDAPAYKLELEGSGGGAGVSIGIQNTGSAPAGINLLSGHGNWSIYNSHSVGDALEFRDESASTTPMLIDSNGNVGIGTTNPLKKLHLVNAGDVALMLQTTNANNDAEIWEMGCGANSSSNADLIFRTRLNSGSGGDERVRFTQDGNLEVSGNQIQVQNTGNCNVLVGSTNASGAAIVLDGDSDGNGSGADYAYIEHDSAGNLNIVQDNPAAGGKIDFFTGGATRVSMQSDKFRPANNEGMTLGTSGLRWGNVYTSGILFGGDTAVANTLDDYEEGTWTPSITGTTSNLGSTSGRAFMYRRIGSVVFFSFDFFQENNNMSLNASCVIDGLPFDSPNLPNNFLSNISVGSIGNAATGNVHATVRNYFTNAAQIVILDAVANSRHFMGQGFYFVA